MRHNVHRRALAMALVALGVWGCTEDSIESTGQGGAGAGGLGGAGGQVEEGASVAGVVHDRSQAAIVDAQLAVCDAADCRPATSDTEGAFSFADVAPGAYRFDARGPASDSPPSLGPITVALDVAPLAAFVFTEPLVLSPTGIGKMLAGGVETIVVTDELAITLDAAQLTLPPNITTPYLAGVLVDEAHWPPNDIPASTVAMWVFNPYGATTATDMKVDISNVFDLAPDQGVELHTIDHETGHVVKVAEGRVSADGLVIENNGPIRRLTWLILALLT